MPTKTKTKHLPGITVDPNMIDCSNSPYILEKVERAKAFIAKHGLPKEVKSKKSK